MKYSFTRNPSPIVTTVYYITVYFIASLIGGFLINIIIFLLVLNNCYVALPGQVREAWFGTQLLKGIKNLQFMTFIDGSKIDLTMVSAVNPSLT